MLGFLKNLMFPSPGQGSHLVWTPSLTADANHPCGLKLLEGAVHCKYTP